MRRGSGASVDARTPEQIGIDKKKVTDWKRSALLSSADRAWPSEISIESSSTTPVMYIPQQHTLVTPWSIGHWSSYAEISIQIKQNNHHPLSEFGGILNGIAMGTQKDRRFVGRPDVLNPYPRPDGETDEIVFEGSVVIPEDFLALQQQFKAEHDALQGKRCVFIPINHGYKSLVEGRI
jgi:hypothetical protein